MPFAMLAAAAALLAPAAADPAEIEASARNRAIAFAEALESGSALPRASPKILLRTYGRPRYHWADATAAQLRGALAGCRRGEAWVYVYGPRTQVVSQRYHCPSDPQSVRWPVLEQEIEDGLIDRAWVSTGPRQLERDKIRNSRPRLAEDSSFPADRAAALALISALQAGRTPLPHARAGLELRYDDNIGNKPTVTAAAAVLRRALAGCRPGPLEAEPRRWLGSRLAMVAFSCPPTHKPHPEMVIMLELLDGRVQSLQLEAGPPPPPIVIRPAP